MKKSFVSGSVLAVAVALCVTSLGFAGSVSFVEVPNGGGLDGAGTNLAGSVTTDVLLDSSGGDVILSQQLRLLVPPGTVFQHAFGSNTPPNSALFGFATNLPYDTFLSSGTADNMGGVAPLPTIVGRSDALGGPGGVPAQMDANGVDALWGPALGLDTTNKSGYLSTRFTLTPNANGSLAYQVSFGSGIQRILDIPILNGHLQFEPPNQPPDVGDIMGDQKIIIDLDDFDGAALVSATLPLMDDDPTDGMWSLVDFVGPGAFHPADVNMGTGLFTWDANGAKGGLYKATIEFKDNGGLTDTGMLEICVFVPEPASLALVSLGLIGLVGLARRRG